MSYWVRKGKYVFVYQHRAGKNVPLPRTHTKHLDGMPDCSLDAFVAELDGPGQDIPVTPPALLTLLDQYIRFISAEGKDPNTVSSHKHALVYRVFEYFVQHARPDPTYWPEISIRMRDWLLDQGVSVDGVLRCNFALRKFWKYHTEEGNISSPFSLNLRNPRKQPKITPLKRVISPDEVLAWATPEKPVDVLILGLVGYFFSLRPQESLALLVDDFTGGEDAERLLCCQTMKAHGLFNRLAVYIDRQIAEKRNTKDPKMSSKGWVACFDKRAAERLIGLLNDLKDGNFVQYGQKWMGERWKKWGIDGLTLKDLRRSSLYWLGHNTSMDYVALRHHARHRDQSTTWLYLRRPEEKAVKSGKLAI